MRGLLDPRALGALLSLTTVAASAGAQNLLTNFGLGHDVIKIDGHAALDGDVYIVAPGSLPDGSTFHVLVADAIADEGVAVHLPAGSFSYAWVDVAGGEALRITHVPEPAALTCAAIIGMTLVARRRRALEAIKTPQGERDGRPPARG